MRSALVAIVLAGTALAIPGVAEARHGCPRAADVAAVTSTSESIVYRKRRGAQAVYGCWRRKGSPYRLNQIGDYGMTWLTDRLALAGRYVAYEQDFLSGAGDANNHVTVRNLRTGRVVRQASSSARGADLGDAATAIVATRSGAVAWIARTALQPNGETQDGFEVRLLDRTTARDSPRLLERGASIEPASLRLTADRRSVTWVSEGQRRTAPIR